jgi:hypothetical protein
LFGINGTRAAHGRPRTWRFRIWRFRILTSAAKRRYVVAVPSKAAISTPFPSAYTVAKTLGVRKKRATHLIRLMDSIHVSDAVSVRVGIESSRPRTASKKKVARRSVRARARRR